jgi:hypothetical protein
LTSKYGKPPKYGHRLERQRFIQNCLIFNFVSFLSIVVKYSHGRSNGSVEHIVRKAMLDNYDKIVLPVRGKDLVVEFGLKLNKLVKVVS